MLVWVGQEGSGVRDVAVAFAAVSVVTDTLKVFVVDFVEAVAVVDVVESVAAVEELEKFLKSAKNPGSIPKVVVPVSLQDCVCVPQYHSPPASPAAGISPAVESQIWRLLSKLLSKPTSTDRERSTYQRICSRGWGS